MTRAQASLIANWINEAGSLANPITIDALLCEAHHYQTMLSTSGDLVGSTMLRRVSWYQAEMSHFVINPALRRRRNGTALLHMTIDQAREKDVHIIQCTVQRQNEGMLKLLDSLGFSRGIEFLNSNTGNVVVTLQRGV